MAKLMKLKIDVKPDSKPKALIPNDKDTPTVPEICANLSRYLTELEDK